MDEEILDAYARSVLKAGEYSGKFINYVELKALIRRFKQLNPDADLKVIDWVGVWDERLEYSELLERFRRSYPMYRWSDEAVSEAEFEDARKKRLEGIIRELDEESLRELVQLARAELGEAAGEDRAEAAEAVPETASNEAVPTPATGSEPARPAAGAAAPTTTLTLRLIARYPVLQEARQFLRAFELGDADAFAERARDRVVEALERGERGTLPREDPIEDLMSFILGRVICLAVGEPWLLRRWALAEAARMERHLHLEGEPLRTLILRRLLPEVEETSSEERRRFGEEYRYKVRVPDYLTLAERLVAPEWMLVNRMVGYGYVYLRRPEVGRVLRQRAYQLLASNAPRVVIRELPPRLQDAVMEVARKLVSLSSVEEAVAPAAGEWPPCMEAIRARVSEAGHKELFALAAFMLNRGYSKEDVLSVLAERPDYNERIARYQVEHIAGERGGGTRYRPPSCGTMRAYGLCVEDGRLCPRWIRNPLDYRRTARQEQKA